MTPETKVKNDILKYLSELQKQKQPIFFERRQACGGNYKKGIPDIYAVYRGIHVEIEVKAENGHLSTMQEKFAIFCRSNQVKWVCAKSVEDVARILDEIK